jgi:hypothetical protein
MVPDIPRLAVVAFEYIAPDGVPLTALIHVPPLLYCH